MFNFHDFLMQGFLDAVGKMADYQVILNASGWMEKGVLTENDLAEIQTAINLKNTPPEPQIPEETEVPNDAEQVGDVE